MVWPTLGSRTAKEQEQEQRQWYFKLARVGNLQVFLHPREGRHIAPMGVKFGTEKVNSSMPNFTPISAGLGCRTLQNYNLIKLYKISHYKCPSRMYLKF